MFDGENGAGGASTETPAQELTLEQQLEALKPTGQESALATGSESQTDPKPNETKEPPADASQSAGSEELLKKLDEIKADEEKPAEEQKPQLSTEQQEVLKAVPDKETADALLQIAGNYRTFSEALATGDFQTVQKMIDPQAYENFLDYVYQQKVATGEWVDRYIADNDTPSHVNQGMRQLQNKIAQLEKQQAERQSREQNAQSQANNDRLVTAYVNHIEGLFNQIEFSEADRPWIRDAINARVQGNPQLQKAILSGNMAAVNATFKEAVRGYVDRDKAINGKKAEQLKEQEKHKPPLQSTPAVNDGALPDDVKQVPKGKEEGWMDQQLSKLFSTVKGRK